MTKVWNFNSWNGWFDAKKGYIVGDIIYHMEMKTFLACLAAGLAEVGAVAQGDVSFHRLAMSEDMTVYDLAELRMTADTVLAYQFPSGGWPKNHQWQRRDIDGREQAERAKLREAMRSTGIGSTIDNDATSQEIVFLAKMYALTRDSRYLKSFVDGINFIINCQYANGGWPQFWPSRGSGYDHVAPYADHITFNDDAMVNVMKLLRDVAEAKSPFDMPELDGDLRSRSRKSFDRGVQCVLDCQIRKDGKLTVWCQQHDEVTLAPAPARAYELPSFTAHGETVDILMLLMDLPNPSDEVKASIKAGVEWLEAHALRGVDFEYFTNEDGKRDRRIVQTGDSSIVNWARYYDLETERPFYCDRDGIKRYDFSEVGYERRNGYSWIGDSPLRVIKRYQKWLKKFGGANR